MNVSYINFLKASKKSENTIKNYTKHINSFLTFVGKADEDITFIDVINYQASLEDLSANTVRLHLASIKSYFDFLVQAHVIEENPAEKIKKPKANPKVKQHMSEEDVAAMIHAARKPREIAMIKFMVSTGVRISELINITIEEYREAIDTDKMITILGKGDKERNIYINEATQESVDAYLCSRIDDCPYLFASSKYNQLNPEFASKSLKTIARGAGLPYWKDISNHWLRSAFATIANEKGYDVKAISEAMGHSSIAVTNTYIRTTQNNINNVMSAMTF